MKRIIIQQSIRQLRVKRVKAKAFGTKEKPRLSVVRTLKHIEAQLIDDSASKTLVAVHDREVGKVKATDKQSSQMIRAYETGKILAEKAVKQKISRVVFDRRGRKYHGRVASLAQGARDGGLKF